MPLLSGQLGLTDVQGGWLFTAQFASSTVGAALSSYFPRKSVVWGYAAVGAGVAVLLVGDYAAAVACFALIGLGVGLNVSAINVIFGTSYPEKRGSLLTRVNLSWGVGAVLAPQFVALAEHNHALRIFLVALSATSLLVFALFTPLLKGKSVSARTSVENEQSSSAGGSLRLLGLFSTMMFLYVGVETAIAGWIATYVHRLNGVGLARASLYVSVFWVSLVAGRALVVALLRHFPERAVLLSGLALSLAGVASLLFPHGAAVALVATIVAGLGCAPIFPLVVARMLARMKRSRHAGWAFAICGSGGAVVPWVTGLVSQHGGLRMAFLAPLAALAAILVCVLIDRQTPWTSRQVTQ